MYDKGKVKSLGRIRQALVPVPESIMLQGRNKLNMEDITPISLTGRSKL